MKTISKDTIVTKKITSGTYAEEFVVKKNSHATIVFMIRADNAVLVKPTVHLRGSDSRATIIGIAYGTKKADIRIITLQHHEAPNTTSSLLIKSVMTDYAQCTYEGSIAVDKNAQRTDAYQRNENLLLSSDAHAISKPSLEILANDVRCTHGAIVKTLDADELWYLATRGITKESSRRIMTRGFLASAADIISDEGTRSKVAKEFERVYIKHI